MVPNVAPGPSFTPAFVPATWVPPTGQTTAVVGYRVLPLVGVNVAFKSPALTDEPLWVRIDDPGSF